MRTRLALPATLATMVLVLAMAQNTRGQQGTRPAPGRPGENQNSSADRGQAIDSETIRGVVAGITAEGEATYDYRANRATMANAAFLTVVGSPSRWDSATGENHDGQRSGEKSASTGRKRHNVYMVWLTPRTKVCETNADSRRVNSAERDRDRSSQGSKREVTLDQLEVGDHVEIQFTRRENSGAEGVAHQTEQMRQKHGRHRTYVGYATEIMIVTPRDDDRTDSGTGGKGKDSGR